MKQISKRHSSKSIVAMKVVVGVLGSLFLLMNSTKEEKLSEGEQTAFLADKGTDTAVECETAEPTEETAVDNTFLEEPPETESVKFSGQIQVCIQNNGYQGLFHEQVSVGTGERKEYYRAGEGANVILSPESFQTDALTVFSIRRSQGYPAYYGTLHITDTPEGLLVTNEVDLETYLQGVLPSEMPAGYPEEALKAQAVCARSYALYQQMQGAVMDDSTNFQVYNNVAPDARCNAAIAATAGTILVDREGNPAEIYYYSTSALDAVEAEENWYRWEYDNEKMSAENLANRINACQPGTIREPGKCKFYDMEVTSHRENGRVQELELSTTEGKVQIVGEYAIRGVLCDGVSKAVLQDGTEIVMKKLIPSGFFSIETIQGGKFMIGYRLSGGGFGHGNGLSQNGAKAYARQGFSYEEILARYYPDLYLEQCENE